jgi:hypothetical protein
MSLDLEPEAASILLPKMLVAPELGEEFWRHFPADGA